MVQRNSSPSQDYELAGFLSSIAKAFSKGGTKAARKDAHRADEAIEEGSEGGLKEGIRRCAREARDCVCGNGEEPDAGSPSLCREEDQEIELPVSSDFD